jgi:DNA-directed RNA polymerase subunit RPC12/RpoP
MNDCYKSVPCRNPRVETKWKALRCPICKSRIIDSNSDIKSELKQDAPDNDWEPDYIQKCWKCGNKIGIKKIG